jgi:hypothetical protein
MPAPLVVDVPRSSLAGSAARPRRPPDGLPVALRGAVVDAGTQLADFEAGEAQRVRERADAVDGGFAVEVAARAWHAGLRCERWAIPAR